METLRSPVIRLERKLPGCCLMLYLCGASTQLLALFLCAVSLHCWAASFTPLGNLPPAYMLSERAPVRSARRHDWLWLHYLWKFTPHSSHTHHLRCLHLTEKVRNILTIFPPLAIFHLHPAVCCYGFARALFGKGVCLCMIKNGE